MDFACCGCTTVAAVDWCRQQCASGFVAAVSGKTLSCFSMTTPRAQSEVRGLLWRNNTFGMSWSVPTVSRDVSSTSASALVAEWEQITSPEKWRLLKQHINFFAK